MVDLSRPQSWKARKAQLSSKQQQSPYVIGYWLKWAWLRGIAVLIILGGLWYLTDPLSLLIETKRERRERHAALWEEVRSAYGSRAPGTSIDALQELNSDSVFLEGLDLPGAWLSGVQLPHAKLARANFSSALLTSAGFRRADLFEADLSQANMLSSNFFASRLENADLRRAQLTMANLNRADLFRAELDQAQLLNAKLKEADLRRSSLRGADFDYADVSHAKFFGADLSGVTFRVASLRGSTLGGIKNWREIRSLVGANVYGITDAPDGFLKWAIDTMGAVQIQSHDDWLAYRRSTFGSLEVLTDREKMPGRWFRIALTCEVYAKPDTTLYPWAWGEGCLMTEMPEDSAKPSLLRPSTTQVRTVLPDLLKAW